MMRRIEHGLYECSEHGGTFDKRAAFDHLQTEHGELAQVAERILVANADHLPVNPVIAAVERNRQKRRIAERKARREAKRRQRGA